MIDLGPSISGLREQTEALAIQATTIAPRTMSPEAKASFLDSINTVKAMVEEKLAAVWEVCTNLGKPQPFNLDELSRDIIALNSLKSALSGLSYPYQSSVRIIQFAGTGEFFSARVRVTLENTTTIRELKNISADIFKVSAESLDVSVSGSILKDEQEFMPLSQRNELIFLAQKWA